ncbi:MAG: hypothetical protein ACT4PK_07650 [Gammaproteobacteria bacterium]
MTPRRLRLDAVAWLAALLPLVAGHGAYLISASQDLVPWCLPHLEGCTSVSRAARTGEANLLFKALMLPYSMLLPLFWWLVAGWLGEVAPQRRRTRLVLFPLGLVAGLATAVYTAALGVDGELYQWMRRYGINLSFAFTVLAELLVAAAIAREPRVPEALRRLMVALCGAMLVLGLASIPLQYLVGTRGPALNAIEWTYAVLMLVFYPLIGAAARRGATTAPAPA